MCFIFYFVPLAFDMFILFIIIERKIPEPIKHGTFGLVTWLALQ